MFVKIEDVNDLLEEILDSFLKFKYQDGDVPDTIRLLIQRLHDGMDAMDVDEFYVRMCDQCIYQKQCSVYITAKAEWTNCAWAIGRVCPNYEMKQCYYNQEGQG